MDVKEGKPRYGSDLVVDLMKAVGIEYVAFNPGSTFRGVMDSLVNYGSGNPKVVLCNHEEISVAIAHGYGVAAGKPMVAITHNIVGLLHATMAVYNAWCDMSPVMVLGGGGPMEVDRRRNWVDWVHTALVQGNVVRDYVKWDDQPFGLTGVVESFLRAYRICTSKPQGPVYICLDAGLQEAPIDEPVAMPVCPGVCHASPIGPDPDVVAAVAKGLVKAEMPVIVADRVGGGEEGMKAMVELAEVLAAPVVDLGRRFNFPNTHPLDLSGSQNDLLGKADFVLALEVEDLFGELQSGGRGPRNQKANFTPRLSPDAEVIDVSLRDLVTRGWSSDYQRFQKVDMTVLADPVLMVRQLAAACRKLIGKATSTARDQRRRELAKMHRQNSVKWAREAEGLSKTAPIASGWLAHELWEVIKKEDWVLAHGELRGWPRRLWQWDVPYRYVSQSGGAGLGHGMGSAIGAALAHQGKGRLLLNIQPDGDLLMTPQAIWTAAQQKLPLLTVMYNNRAYFNSVTHASTMARGRGRPLERQGIGTLITDPNVDFAAMARSFGAYGEGPIEDPARLRPALERAVRVIRKEGRPALVDVVCRGEERAAARRD